MISKFPLQWPAAYKRTASPKRSAFKVTSLDKIRKGIQTQIKLLGGTQPIISSNIPVRTDGELYATARPSDGEHGVAVYFTYNGVQRVIACDSYTRIEENLRAIELSIEAIRTPQRHKIADGLNAVFSGFQALPQATTPPIAEQQAPKGSNTWWQILNVTENADPEVIKSAWKRLLAKYHPDNQVTGDREKFDQVQKAYASIPKT